MQNTHEPIISLNEWESTQTRLAKAAKSTTNNTVRRGSANEISLFSGIIKCADCGASMAYSHKVRKCGVEKRVYRCGRYVNNGRTACSTHTIDADLLEQVLLRDIQCHAKTAVRDEQGLLDRLMAFTNESSRNESAAIEATLRETKSRISFIEAAIKQLFEEKVSGNVSEAIFKKMMSGYQQEIEVLHQKSTELREKIQENRNNLADAQRWMKLIKECSTINRLDRATVYQLVDQVSVYEQSDKCDIRTQTVQIKYNFVGCVSLNQAPP